MAILTLELLLSITVKHKILFETTAIGERQVQYGREFELNFSETKGGSFKALG